MPLFKKRDKVMITNTQRSLLAKRKNAMRLKKTLRGKTFSGRKTRLGRRTRVKSISGFNKALMDQGFFAKV